MNVNGSHVRVPNISSPCCCDSCCEVVKQVQSVCNEMYRHVLGHEDMEASPVARWYSKLQQALSNCKSTCAE